MSSTATSTKYSSFHFHNFDPKANEEKKRVNKEMLVKNTHNGMAFKPSKYMMVPIQSPLNRSSPTSPSSPIYSHHSSSNGTTSQSNNCSLNTSYHTHHSNIRTIRNEQNPRSRVKQVNKPLVMDPQQWDVIAQSIESRSRNISNCSNFSNLSKASCNIDTSSLNSEYSNKLVTDNFPTCNISGRHSNCQSEPQFLVHYASVKNYSNNFDAIPESFSSLNQTPTTDMPLIRTSSLSSVLSSPNSFNSKHNFERLPSIHHLLKTALPSRIEKPSRLFEQHNIKSVSTALELLKQ